MLLLLLSCSVMFDSVQPHRQHPTRLLCPWDSPDKNTGVGFHFLLQCKKVKSESEVAQLCLTLSDPMDCSLPGSSIHGIFQARVLEWVAISFSNFCLSHGFISLNFCGYDFILFILFVILLSILSQKFYNDIYFFFCFFLIYSEFCHTLKWNSHGFTCVPHPDPPSHLPLHPVPLGLPSAPGPSACLMHPTWAGDLFHPR